MGADNQKCNIDDELEELFRKDGSCENSLKSDLLTKMEGVRIAEYMISLQEMARPSTEKSKDFNIPNRKKLVEDELQYQDGILTGKHFSWMNSPGGKTLVYRIIRCADYQTKMGFYDVELLDSVSLDDEEQMFFVDAPDEVEQLIFISFYKNEVFVNRGELINNNLCLAAHPSFVHITKHIKKKIPTISLSTHDVVTEDYCDIDQNHVWTANLDSHCVIIDPETCKPILREAYYDEAQEKWKSRVTLSPNKSYFSFVIRDVDSGKNTWMLIPYELGLYYAYGMYGFPCDKMCAAQYFEEDSSPEAWYQIASIFFGQGEFHDETLGLEYLEKSAFAGCNAARVELAIWYYCHDKGKLSSALELIQKAVDDEFPPALFVAAYSYEKGIGVERDLERAFELYFKAANCKYAPAIRRLSDMEEVDGIAEKDRVHNNFLSSLEDETHYAEFCLGGVLLGKVYIESYKYGREYENSAYLCVNGHEGAKLILDAAEHGCRNALLFSAEVLEDGLYGFEIDKQKSLTYYEQLTDSSRSIAIKVSNWLLDGIGCDQCPENDKKAWSILADLIEEGKGTSTACNNLGWMFKNGRGCERDYEAAKAFFEQAINWGCATSYYHLASLYEEDKLSAQDGEDNMTKAIQLLRAGAEKGNEKCKNRLAELKIATNAGENASQTSLSKELSEELDFESEAPYIFVSYSHKDKEEVFKTISLMKKDGFVVWHDEGIDPGTEWDVNIDFHVQHCGYMVAFLSHNYFESENCKDELKYARDLGKRILLIYLEDVQLPPGISLRLNRSQAIYKGRYSSVEEFMDKLAGAAGIEGFRK